MKRKYFLSKMTTTVAVAGMMFSSILAFAAEPELPEEPVLPESITIDGKEFIMDTTAGGGRDTATADGCMNMVRSSYKLLGSDVRLYIDKNSHGGDHVSSGWVRTTAPRFTARAEIWANNRVNTSGSNTLNRGDIAEATSHPAAGLVKDAKPRIFYSW